MLLLWRLRKPPVVQQSFESFVSDEQQKLFREGIILFVDVSVLHKIEAGNVIGSRGVCQQNADTISLL